MSRHSRQALAETWLILITWCVFCAWVLVVCAPHYQTINAIAAPTPAAVAGETSLQTVWGLPAWVFWGIAVPWCAATTLTIIFALRLLQPIESPEDRDE